MAKRLLMTPFGRNLEREGSVDVHRYLELFLPGVMRHEDDFVGDLFKGGAAPGIYQSSASGANSAVAALDLGAANGQITLDPGDANSGRSDLSLGLHFTGSRNAVVWWRANMRDAVTSSKFELGFTDVISGTDAGAVNSKSANTWNATDAVVLIRDTSDDTNLTLMAVANNTAETVIDFNTSLAANTMYWFGIGLVDGQAIGFLYDTDGKEIERTTWMDVAVTSTVLLTPWAFVQNRSAAQRRLNIDKVLAYQRETTA